jgi:HEAT repeat protein
MPGETQATGRPPAAGFASRPDESAEIVPAPAQPPVRQEDTLPDRADHGPLAADPREAAADVDELEGADRVLAILSKAIRQSDHARIKECMDQLVAMGDAAVVPLNDLVNAEDSASLWAAEALARIGTPLATTALLDTLSQTKEGLYKEELGRRIAGIHNHESWPILLDTALQTGDQTVVRAAGTALSQMADTPVVDGMIARYEAATTEEEISRLTRMLGNIRSPKATDALLSLAGPVNSPPIDGLAEAAVEALAKVGDPRAVSHLIQRLEASPPGEGATLYNTIKGINHPGAKSALYYAARGNKEVSATNGRTAAIEALRNYPDEKTLELLERIVIEDDNAKVKSAATRTIEDIRREPHAVTAKSDSLVKPDPLAGLRKKQ